MSWRAVTLLGLLLLVVAHPSVQQLTWAEELASPAPADSLASDPLADSLVDAPAVPKPTDPWRAVLENKYVCIGGALGFGAGLLLVVFGRRRPMSGIAALMAVVGATLVGAGIGYALSVLMPIALFLAGLAFIVYIIWLISRIFCCPKQEC